MNLQLSLKKEWFEMTKSGVKTEDYREINEYWTTRLTSNKNTRYVIGIGETDYTIHRSAKDYDKHLKLGVSPDRHWMKRLVKNIVEDAQWKPFETNTVTLGYPKSTNLDRILKLEHKGIEIRTGNPEWGAEPDKLYFVIKHGAKIEL